MTNDHLVLLCGKSATGKSASLMNLKNPEGVLYLNCEAGKKLPFKSKFIEKVVTDPYQIYEAFQWAEQNDKVHTVVIDSLTYLMNMFEAVYVSNSSDGRKAWNDYKIFFMNLMLQYVPKSSKNIVITAHTKDFFNETEMVIETKVPIQGSLANVGVESFFSTVIASKKVPLKALEKYSNGLLSISSEEEALGFKYVFQTKLTKETVNERLRGPMDLFSNKETYTDNDIQKILDRLKEYYS